MESRVSCLRLYVCRAYSRVAKLYRAWRVSPGSKVVLPDVLSYLVKTNLELLVAKLMAFFSLLMLGMVRLASAAEIADAPIPEPNYIGILVFLGLCFGLGGWFMWRVMRNKGDDDKK